MEFTFDNRLSDSPLVDWVWRTESDSAGTFISQAACNWEMVIWRYQGETHITLRGPETRAALTDSPAGAEFFGIVLKPGVFMPHLPTSQLTANPLTLPLATGHAFWMHGAVWPFPTFENADTFIDRLVRDDLLVRDPVIPALLEGHPPDLSVRALQYRFLRATGMPQATFHQITRAKHAAALLRQGTSILDTVFEAGYFDQAHLTRSLNRFMGQTPSQLAASARR